MIHQTSRTIFLAIILLIIMAVTAIFSMVGDSATMDELAHLPAGYSYLVKQDMRLNPEHPPLIKDLAAFPLLFIRDVNFPENIKAWQEDLNGQWDFGTEFLYKSGNDADKLIFWGRIPMVAIMFLLGLILFFGVRSLWGNATALLTLFFYSFSPTFLAHGRLVTTDVGAAFGVVLATIFFLNFLKNPSWKNTIFAGLTFGISQLIKFNLILLYPFFGLLLIVWIITRNMRNMPIFIKNIPIFWGMLEYFVKFAVIIAVAWILIWPIYAFHVQNMPKDLQLAYVKLFTRGHPAGEIVIPLTTFLSQTDILRPWGYYMLGVDMATQRASGGHTVYFMGEVSAAGWVRYFPIVYILKEPLAFHILTVLALLYMAIAIRRQPWQEPFKRLRVWISAHFAQFAMLLWLAIYWTASLISNLNIGMRHLLPVLPFTYALVSWATVQWAAEKKENKQSARQKYSDILRNVRIFLFADFRHGTKYLFIGALMIWQIINILLVYPHFISYFNELAGGPSGGSRYVVDSNLDWGQDLKRLAKYVEEKNIDKIKIAYFGGGNPKYYLGDRAEDFKWEEPQTDWVAVSATFLRGGQALPSSGFEESTDHFYWLFPYEPVTIIGNSIFVYYIPPTL